MELRVGVTPQINCQEETHYYAIMLLCKLLVHYQRIGDLMWKGYAG